MAFDWGSIIADAIAAYGAKNQSPGKFTQIPEDPSLTAIRKKVLGFVDDSPTRDFMGGLIKPRLENAQGWNAPPGKYGYSINDVPAPKYDLSKLMPSIAKPTTPTTGSKPNGDGAAGAIKSGPSPVKIEGPLNKDIVFDDEFGGGGGGPKDGESIYDYLGRNPGGRPQSYLPNQGQSGTTPYGDFVHSDEMKALQDQYGATATSLWELAKKYGPTILASYFLGPYAPVAKAIFKAFTGSEPANTTTGGSGFIPGSISGQPPPAGKP